MGGWLTPLIPHISGGRRGSRWRVAAHPTIHGEAMSFELGDKVATQMEREWFHAEQALDIVFQRREWRVEAIQKRLAREERVEVLQRRIVVTDPGVHWTWVATKNGKFRHATSSPLYRYQQFRRLACGAGWVVHQCGVDELQRLPVCGACAEAIEGQDRDDFLIKEAGNG